MLALRAFVLSAPYDVPPWLPDVLLALVRAGADPPPVRPWRMLLQSNRHCDARDLSR